MVMGAGVTVVIVGFQGQTDLIFCLLQLNLTDCSVVVEFIYRNCLEGRAYPFAGDNRCPNEATLLECDV